jgi:hypothetical protein
MDLIRCKKNYLKRFNTEKSEELALVNAINAAVRHNQIYDSNISALKKLQIKEHWKSKLRTIAKKYKRNVTNAEYEADIVNLKSQLLKSYKSDIPYFKLSHAQKSIAVFLKHMWCLNAIITPPQCPIDRVILNKLGGEFRTINWTELDDIRSHRNLIIRVRARVATSGLSLAEWELINY